jgi:hypothetical protein
MQLNKACIITSSNRVSLNSKNVRSRELYFIRQWLLTQDYDVVDFVSKPTKFDIGNQDYKSVFDIDFNDYSAVYIYNQPTNFFGGVTELHTIVQYEKLANYNGRLVYIQTDPKITFKAVWRHLFNRQIPADNKLGRTIDPFTVIELDDVFSSKLELYYTGTRFTDVVSEIDYTNKTHIDLFTFMHTFEHQAMLPLTITKLEDKAYDFVYWGNDRGSQRNKTLNSYFNNSDFSKLVVGFEPKWPLTTSKDYVKLEELVELIPTAKFALVVGDPIHNNSIKTPRFFESLCFDLFSFIHIDFDPQQKYIDNQELKSVMYVSSLADLKNKIKIVEQDYSYFVNLQHEFAKSLTETNVYSNNII